MYRFAYLTYGLFVCSAGVTFVFLEDIETEFGISSVGIGAIAAMSFVMALLAALFVSPLGDRGYVKELAIAGFITGGIGNVWFGLASSFWEFFIARGLASLGIGLFGIAARKALIGDTADGSAEKLGGLVSAAVAGFILGPALGAALEPFGGMITPFLALTVALGVVAIPTARWLSATVIATSESVTVRSMFAWLRRPLVRAAVATHSAVFFNIGVFDATVDELLTDLGASTTQVAMILVVIAAPLLVVPTLAGRLVDRHPRPMRVMLAAHLVFIPVVALLSFTAAIVFFILLSLIQTTVESVVFPAGARVAVNETGAEQSAAGQGVLDAVGQLAAAVSAFAAPVMFDITDGPLGSFGLSAVVGLGLLLYAASQARIGMRTPAPTA